jgi:MurNAc alpha-1-phosphate uridylyltransferase
MKAIVFAAGRGKRMRPLSDVTPKPLLTVWGSSMLEWHLMQLRAAGITEIVCNTAHLAAEFPKKVGNGSQFGVNVTYSEEGLSEEDALETRGGIAKALPLLAGEDPQQPFLAVAGDIVTDFDYRRLRERAVQMEQEKTLAHLILVPNPSFHRGGDMGLADGIVTARTKDFTYGCIALFKPALFAGVAPSRAPLFPWLYEFVNRGLVSGELYRGFWNNVGDPQMLEALRESPVPPFFENLKSGGGL